MKAGAAPWGICRVGKAMGTCFRGGLDASRQAAGGPIRATGWHRFRPLGRGVQAWLTAWMMVLPQSSAAWMVPARALPAATSARV